MKFDLKSLIPAAIATIRDPQAGARQVMNVSMERRQRWEVLLLIVALSVLAAMLTLALEGAQGRMVFGEQMLKSPLSMAFVQLTVMLTLIVAIFLIGRRAGGDGSLDDTILLMAWMQFILICLQMVQTISFFLIPPLGSFIGLFGLFLFFWLLTAFVTELHGFKSRTSVFVSILIGMVGFAILFSVILSFLGIEIAIS